MICYKCKGDKPDIDFGSDKTRFHHREYICKDCKNERSRRYYQNNKEILNTKRIAKVYKLSDTDYKNLQITQNGLCALCGLSKPLVVDHNHRNGAVRGLLCRDCNIGLGLFGDSVDLLQRASNYLRRN